MFGKFKLPVAAFEFLAAIRLVFLPVVEVADKVDVRRVRCPFAENPAVARLVQAVVQVPAREVGEGFLAVLRELRDFPNRVFVPPAYCVFIRRKPHVLRHQANVFLCHNFTSLNVFRIFRADCNKISGKGQVFFKQKNPLQLGRENFLRLFLFA